MLPSLIKTVFRVRDHESVGFMIGRDYITSALIKKTKNQVNLLNSGDYRYEYGHRDNSDANGWEHWLDVSLHKLNESLPDRYVQIHVSLADPFVNVINLDFDALPVKEAQVREIVAWRLKNEYGYGSDDFVYQPFGSTSHGAHLLVVTIKDEWRTMLSVIKNRQDFTCWSIAPDIFRLFNIFYQEISPTSGALIHINDDYWTLLIWDSDAQVRSVLSHWRGETDVYGDIADEIERSIIAYVNSGEQRSVEKVYLLHGGMNSQFEAEINAKLHHPCTPLTNIDHSLSDYNHSGVVDLRSLSAALDL